MNTWYPEMIFMLSIMILKNTRAHKNVIHNNQWKIFMKQQVIEDVNIIKPKLQNL